jgi:hypothetical protein
MLNIDKFSDLAFQQKQADNDRVATAAFQTIYSNAIAKMADGETLDPEDQQRFQQAAGFWNKSPEDIAADVAEVKARRAAQITIDKAGSIHAKSAYINAMFRAAGISPLRDTPGYRDSLSAQAQEVESELVMLRQAEALLAGHEPMASTSTTADGLPGEVAIHESCHAVIGTALGARLESLSVSAAGGITIFSEGVDGDIQQAAVMLAGSVGVAKLFNQPVFSHLSKQDGLNLLRLLADRRDCVRALQRAQHLAECIITAHEGIILGIARKLEQHGRLTADDLATELAGVDDWRYVAAQPGRVKIVEQEKGEPWAT